MENFLLGLQAIAHSMRVTLVTLVSQPLLWGFGLGVAASLGISAILLAGSPRHAYHMMTKPAERCYGLLCRLPGARRRVTREYHEFCREHHRIRTLFYAAVLALLIVVGIALLRY